MNSIEKKISDILDQLSLRSFFIYNLKFQEYFIDFADKTNKIAIEVQGTYWHKHFLSKNYEKGRKRRVKDRIKKIALIAEGWHVIYVWEHTLNKNPLKIKNYLEKEIIKRIEI
jgi:very-short-patch-repair endonuclease